MQKNKATLLFFIILFSLNLYSCKRKTTEINIIPDALKNHLQRNRILGKVYSIETNTYYYSNKDSAFIFFNKNIQYYNSEGYLAQVLELDYLYDTISKKTLYYLPNAQENYWKEYNYKDFSVSIDTFIYDRNGYIKEERFMFHDSLLYRIEYKTDGIGGIIAMNRFFREYYLTNKIYYTNKGLTTRIEEYDPLHTLYKFFSIDYDNYGNEVNRCAYKNSDELIEYTYTQYHSERQLRKIIFEDRLHNQREDKFYTQHDASGNWLEETVFQGKDTLGKRLRKIEYYSE
jgi:hypothetical protein